MFINQHANSNDNNNNYVMISTDNRKANRFTTSKAGAQQT